MANAPRPAGEAAPKKPAAPHDLEHSLVMGAGDAPAAGGGMQVGGQPVLSLLNLRLPLLGGVGGGVRGGARAGAAMGSGAVTLPSGKALRSDPAALQSSSQILLPACLLPACCACCAAARSWAQPATTRCAPCGSIMSGGRRPPRAAERRGQAEGRGGLRPNDRLVCSGMVVRASALFVIWYGGSELLPQGRYLWGERAVPKDAAGSTSCYCGMQYSP